MDAKQWEYGSDWAEMIGEWASHPSNFRRLRLWVVACCRCLLSTPLLREYVSFQDTVNDNWESADPPPLDDWARQLTFAERFADGGMQGKHERYRSRAPLGGPWNIFRLPMSRSRMNVPEVVRTLEGVTREYTVPGNVMMASLIRDIFGNPFRPVAFDPRWRTEHTVGLAAKMYEDRDFAAMPILADALEEAGCDSETILSHCREPGVHVRGCWVVDLVLGKS